MQHKMYARIFREEAEKMMRDLGITDYWFIDNDTKLVVSKRVKTYCPPEGRDLLPDEVDFINSLGLQSVN